MLSKLSLWTLLFPEVQGQLAFENHSGTLHSSKELAVSPNNNRIILLRNTHRCCFVLMDKLNYSKTIKLPGFDSLCLLQPMAQIVEVQIPWIPTVWKLPSSYLPIMLWNNIGSANLLVCNNNERTIQVTFKYLSIEFNTQCWLLVQDVDYKPEGPLLKTKVTLILYAEFSSITLRFSNGSIDTIDYCYHYFIIYRRWVRIRQGELSYYKPDDDNQQALNILQLSDDVTIIKKLNFNSFSIETRKKVY